MARRNYKKEVIQKVYELTEIEENREKLRHNYYYLKFLGLNWDYTQKKTSMACNPNRFSTYEYSFLLQEIKRVCA